MSVVRKLKPQLKGASFPVAGACFLLAAAAGIAPSQAADPRAASMVIDANTGAVLHNKSGDETVYPASLTKMMTLYMAFELIEAGRMSYATKIKVTEEAAAVAPSKLDLEPGAEITALDAFKALITKSANDMAVALAQHIGGTEANFARLMTLKAREIGMSHTTFRNASGLPDPEQVTTARDMLTLALRLQDDFPVHYKLFATRAFSYAGHTYRNHNTLLTRYRGTDGIKTGYTRASGFNLISSVRREGKHVVAAVFGGDTARERNVKMQSVLNAAFAKASTKVTRKPDRELIANAPQPVRATAPGQVADTASPKPVQQPEPQTPAAPKPAREQDTSIALAKVRPVLIGSNTTSSPAFAFAGAAATGLGLPPSTLGAQAAALERNAPAPQAVASLSPREEPVTKGNGKTARGPFEIQIGAYADSDDAERHMAAARERANGKLDHYRGIAMPVKNGSNQLYRARFRGFDATAANDACAQLKRAQIDCFVLKTE